MSEAARWEEVQSRLEALLQDETDWIASLSTIAGELHHAFAHFHWTGFYRLVRDDLLVLGPYQGGHGCLRIEGGRGVCGAAVRTRSTLHLDDVGTFPEHIACSASTRSELVVPVITPRGRVLAVLDVDSDLPAAFGEDDRLGLESICAGLGRRFADLAPERL